MSSGIKLKNCNKTEESKDLHEPIICDGISKNGSVVWHHQYKAVLAQCSVAGNCSTSYSDDYNITRGVNSTVSHLRILKGGTEDHGVVISCDDRMSSTNDSCTLILKSKFLKTFLCVNSQYFRFSILCASFLKVLHIFFLSPSLSLQVGTCVCVCTRAFSCGQVKGIDAFLLK